MKIRLDYIMIGLAVVLAGAIAYATVDITSVLSNVEPPDTAVETAATLNTDDAIMYIQQGEAILSMALDAFNDDPNDTMGQTLLGITDDFNLLLGGLCQVEGTEAACTTARYTVVSSYNTLLAYVKGPAGGE